MIKGLHAMFYTVQAEELRVFLRDQLGLPGVDVGEGWLIFDLPEVEVGCHPEDAAKGAPAGTHSISFYCDDIETTVAELRARGVAFEGGITDAGYGRRILFAMPGGVVAELYQPHYTKSPREQIASKPARTATGSRT